MSDKKHKVADLFNNTVQDVVNICRTHRDL